MTDVKLQTATASLCLQFLLGILTLSSLAFDIGSENQTITEIVILESVSQLVEFLWYSWVVCYYRKIITWTRYIDWVFSTPIMILSTIAFFEYSRDKTFRIIDLFSDGLIYIIFITNWLMLLYGFLVETNKAPMVVGLTLGTMSFILSWYLIAWYAINSKDVTSMILFGILYTIWALYGVAATLSDNKKNVFYNILDLFSKNLYGAFLFAYSIHLSQNK